MKNGKPMDLETRLESLEADVREIKAMLEAQRPKQGWKAIAGTFADDPVFAEILRLGNEVREKERAAFRRKQNKAKVKS
jgi:hypothetical protein